MKRPNFYLWKANQRQKFGRFVFFQKSIAGALVAAAVFTICASSGFAAETAQKKTPPKSFTRSLYSIVPAHKSLTTSPQFFLIDDFNSPEWKNTRGGIWHLQNAASKEAQASRERRDARNPQFGSSLQIGFNLPKGKSITFLSSLERLDVSQADLVIFSCKLAYDKKDGFGGSLRVALEDWRAKRTVIDITASCSGDQAWNEVTLQRSLFPDVDWDQLNTISFILTSGPRAAKGRFQIDELAFYGANEVAFESHRDNLKGFPKTVFDEVRREKLRKIKNNRELLRGIAADTWKYFEAAQDHENDILVDHIRLGDAPLASDYTSPTNLGIDLMTVVAAEKMKLISRAEAMDRVAAKLRTIDKLRRWKNLYYNYYETTRLSVTRGFISSVDNGWLGISLVVVRQAWGGEFYRDATRILNRMDFSEFLDYENNQLSLGFDSEKNELVGTHYGMLVSEARAISLFGIGKGDLPEDHWWSLYRTPPESWVWQTQTPKGHEVEHGGIRYFQGYYRYGDMKIVPSWGGSLFEFLMPTLVLDEKNHAAKSFGMNNFNAVQAHKDYALNKQGYPIWGLSPAATTNGRTWKYGEYGVKAIGVKGYSDQAVVTPHVSFLALEMAPGAAIKNIRTMLDMKMYGEYGLYDSIQVKTGRVNTQYLALDQGMTFLALTNYLEGGYIQKLFQKDPIGKKAAELWKEERFFDKT